MYAIIVKDEGNIYDVIGVLQTTEETRAILDAEWNKNLPIIGINATNHKETATKGATWNGTSFDGTAAPGFFALTQEEKDAYHQYVFVCDNKVFYRIGFETGSEKAAMYDAAFSGEVLLVKCSFVLSGTKVTYDQTTRELLAV